MANMSFQQPLLQWSFRNYFMIFWFMIKMISWFHDLEIFCNNIHVFSVTFNQCNVSLLNKIINLFLPKKILHTCKRLENMSDLNCNRAEIDCVTCWLTSNFNESCEASIFAQCDVNMVSFLDFSQSSAFSFLEESGRKPLPRKNEDKSLEWCPRDPIFSSRGFWTLWMCGRKLQRT